MNLDHRQRVLTAFDHREPDRVPRGIYLVEAQVEQFKDRTGREDYFRYWDLDLETVWLEQPQIDWQQRFGRYYREADGPYVFRSGGDYPPEWGIAQRLAGLYHFSCPLHPLQGATSLRQIEDYPFPDYLAEWGHDHLETRVESLHAHGYPVSGWCQRIFQTAWYLRSREQLFLDFHESPAMAEAILERVTQISRSLAVRVAEAGVDVLKMADDIGMQDRMMISPTMWRRWIKPRAASVFAAARKVNPRLHIAYHTDGHFEPVIPDLIDIGVNILNTVQPECMDVFKVKRQWGREVSLMGTVGVQSTLRFGSPAEVRDMVKEQIEVLGRDGGFFLSPSNCIEPDVPWDNLIAFFDAAEPRT